MKEQPEIVTDKQQVSVLIDCSDKRFTRNRPAANWCKEALAEDSYLIATAGPVTAFSEVTGVSARVLEDLTFFRENFEVTTVVIVAHDECKANPVEKGRQLDQLFEAAFVLRRIFEGKIILLYLDQPMKDVWVPELVQIIPSSLRSSSAVCPIKWDPKIPQL